jgi:signal transduction histidine kinase
VTSSIQPGGTAQGLIEDRGTAPDHSPVLHEHLDFANRRVEELTAANDAMRSGISRLVSLRDLDSFLGEMLRSAAEAAGSHTGAVVLLDADGTHYRFAAVLERSGGLAIPSASLLMPNPVTPELQGWIDEMVRSTDNWPVAPDDPLHAPEIVAFHEAQGNRALRHIPMMADTRLVGWLGLGFADLEPVLADKFALLQALADQMTMAVELLRLADAAKMAAIAFEREKSAQERADDLANVNSVLTSSLRRMSGARDMRELLAHVFGEIVRVTGASNVAATRYNAATNQLQLELFHDESGPRFGLSGREIALWASPYDANITPAFQIGLQHRHIFVASMLKDQTELPIEEFALPGGLEWMAAIGASDAAVSILFAGNEPVGTFHLHFTGGRTLRPDDLPLLNALSQQAAIALRLVTLSEEAQEAALARQREFEADKRAEELARANQALNECIQSLRDIENLEGFLEAVLLASERVSGSAGAAAFVYGPDDRLYMKAYVQDGRPRDVAKDPEMAAWREPVEWTTGFKEIWKDICGSKGYWFSLADDPKIDRKYREWHKDRGQTLTLCLPLAQGDRFLGFLGLAFQNEHQVNPERLDLMKSLAQQTTLAVEANRLALQARNEAVRREQQRAAQERAAEQAAIARERELEAEVRAAEANRISSFLGATLGQMSGGADLRITIEFIVEGLGKEIGAAQVFLFRHDAATRSIHLELSWVDGQIRHGLSGEELPLWAAPFRDDITPAWQIMVEKRGLFTPEMAPIPAEQFNWPGVLEYVNRNNLSDVGHIILFAGDDPVGSIGFSLRDGRKLRPADKPFIEGVAKQAALAIRMLDLAEQAKQAAISAERERSERARSLELSKANHALQATADAISTLNEMDEIVPAILKIIARTFHGPSAAYYEIGPDRTIYLRYYINDGQVISGAELLAGDGTPPYDLPKLLAAGFKVKNDYAGAEDYRNLRTRIIDHRKGTSGPVFDAWRRKHNREMELNIPLMRGGQPFGVLTLSREAERAYTDAEVELAEAVVKQFCLAVQAARIAEDSRQKAVAIAVAREQELAAENAAQEMSKANQELEVRNRLLSVVAEVATRLARIDDFEKSLRDALEMIGIAGQFSRVLILKEQQRPAPRKGADHIVIAEWCAPDVLTHAECGTNVISSDIAASFLDMLRSGRAFWCQIEEVAYPLRAAFERMGIKATGCAPLMLDGGYWGNVAFDDCARTNPWDNAHVDALTVVAQAISNALQALRDTERLAAERERSAKERAQELVEINSQLRDNLLTLSEGGDSQKTLQHILASALKQLQASEACVFSLDEGAQSLQITASADSGTQADTPLTERLGRCVEPFPAVSLPLWSRFIAARDAVVMDARKEEDAILLREGARKWHLDHDRPVILAVPLTVANRLLGYLSVTFSSNQTAESISSDQIRMAQSLASLAAMTIETDRLAKRAQDAAIAEDRNRLAHELHDTLAGAFTGIFMQLQAASDLPDSQSEQRRACIMRAEDLARNGLRQVREFVHTLTINGEDRWKTVEVMRKIVSDATAGTGIVGTFVVNGTERLLKASAAHALQRILQEAVGNAQRYANATTVDAALQFEEESVRMTIRDDGAGFDAQSVSDSGFGIPGMRTRVARLAGTFSIDSARGRGTTISVRLPEPYEMALR